MKKDSNILQSVSRVLQPIVGGLRRRVVKHWAISCKLMERREKER